MFRSIVISTVSLLSCSALFGQATKRLARGAQRLDAMTSFAKDGMMIPEQVWDRNESPSPELRFGAGTGSATPLAWSMAQFVHLAIKIKQGHNVETPTVPAARYLKGSAKIGSWCKK